VISAIDVDEPRHVVCKEGRCRANVFDSYEASCRGIGLRLFAQLVNLEMPEAARVASRPGTPQRLSISANKLIQAKDMHGVVMVQSEFFQEQMRALTDQTKSIGESAMKAATGAFTPKG
jgi:hypothetical protein